MTKKNNSFFFGFQNYVNQTPTDPHARPCCEGFFGCRPGEIKPEIPEIFCAFGLQFNAFIAVGILLKYLRRNLPAQFE